MRDVQQRVRNGRKALANGFGPLVLSSPPRRLFRGQAARTGSVPGVSASRRQRLV
ncbi:hypothetical protein [Streptomyces sp. NPDC056689]|uniref:hypothetical protein n=1 Tax=unclassified Streptomyces TaxID=2593676 RepID=UPI00363A7F64